MWQFFMEGGPGMWGILVLGVVFLAAAGHYAWRVVALDDRVDAARRRFLVVLAVIVAVASLHSVVIDMGKVFSFVPRFPEPDRMKLAFQGMSESTRPAIFGGGILVVGLILFAVGCYRRARGVARSARAGTGAAVGAGRDGGAV